MNRNIRRALAAIAVALLLATGVPGTANARETALAANDTATWQTNNTVRKLVYANGMIFVGGEFTSVRPPGAPAGTNEVPRSYLAAFSASTGELIREFNPSPNGRVWSLAASPDGTRVYVGGDFTQLGSLTRQRLAAIDTRTLGVVQSFRPNVSYRVTAISATNDSVYFGGSFGRVNNNDRVRAAAVTASDSTLLPWNPAPDGDVSAMLLSPDNTKVYVGGLFSNIGGSAQWALASVDTSAGTNLPLSAASAIPPRSSNCVSWPKDLITDGDDTVYVANAGDGGGCFDGTFAFRALSGNLVWKNTCLGATEAIELVGGWLYKGSHAHDCASEGQFATGARQLLAQDIHTGEVKGWYPNTNVGGTTKVGPFAMATDGRRLWVGGDFTTVNNRPQQGLGIFGPDPQTSPTRPLTPSVTSTKPGTAKIVFQTTLDNDDENLTYRVYRAGTPEPIHTETIRSRFWSKPTVTVIDAGLQPGSQVAYRVDASDGATTVASYWSLYTTVTDRQLSYQETVPLDGAAPYWRFEETSGTSAADSSSAGITGTYSGVTLGQPGVLPSSRAAGLGRNGKVTSRNFQNNPQTFTVEAWIRTDTRSGGRIVGFGNESSNTSGNYDRHLYMHNDGRVSFGVYDGSTNNLQSGLALNDGEWHHLAGTYAAGTMEFFVDGVSQGTRNLGPAQNYQGYWRVGADTLSGWPNQPINAAMEGLVDEVAVYGTALAADDVRWHYGLARGQMPPVAAFTAACAGLVCTFDGTGSTDPDGSVAEWQWDFGDGTTATGAIVEHTYSSGGSKTVHMTIKDDSGLTAERSSVVTPTAPNLPPVADFAVVCTELDCVADGRASSDPDGSIAEWNWDFGDGETASGATVDHKYKAGGTYAVGLTVVDDLGAATSSQQTVTVEEAALPVPSVFAKDTFGRQISRGFGSADQGGAWSVAGTTTRYKVEQSTAHMTMLAPGNAPSAMLNAAQSRQSDVSAVLELDKDATGGGVYVSLVGRGTANGDYRAKVRYIASGRVYVSIVRTDASGNETYLAPETLVPNLTGRPGQKISIRFQVAGTSGSQLGVKAWPAGTNEPAAWNASASDTTAALQGPGIVGIRAHLSGSATNAPVTLRITEFLATTPR